MDSKSDSVRDFILKEVPDWDDEVLASARFKDFSGQRSDWQPRFLFWRDLIIKIARHFRLFLIRPSQVPFFPLLILNFGIFCLFLWKILSSFLVSYLNNASLKVKNDWFNRGGLTPLCLDHVLVSKMLFALHFLVILRYFINL